MVLRLSAALVCALLLPACLRGGTLRASDYDQGCAVDSDCVAVVVGDACSIAQCGCVGGAIRASALEEYEADRANAQCLVLFRDTNCECGEGRPTCTDGRCAIDRSTPKRAVGAACVVNMECLSGSCIAGSCMCPVACPSETCSDPACACNVDTDAPCAAGAVCSGGVCGTSCTEPAARGASCLHRSDDDPCPTSGTCADGLVCAVRDFGDWADGACAPPAGRAVNEPCAQTAECAAELICDAASQTCVVPSL